MISRWGVNRLVGPIEPLHVQFVAAVLLNQNGRVKTLSNRHRVCLQQSPSMVRPGSQFHATLGITQAFRILVVPPFIEVLVQFDLHTVGELRPSLYIHHLAGLGA